MEELTKNKFRQLIKTEIRDTISYAKGESDYWTKDNEDECKRQVIEEFQELFDEI